MRFTVEESIDGATFAPVDYSSANAKVYFRAWLQPVGSQTASDFVINAEQTKVGDGSGGKFDTKNTITSSYGEIFCALVSVDEASANAAAPSGYVEEVLKVWTSSVEPTIQPNP